MLIAEADEEGLRRPLADICLLCFHLVLSSFVHQGVDIPLAQQILEWNLKRFPDGKLPLLNICTPSDITSVSQAYSSYSAPDASACCARNPPWPFHSMSER